MPPPRTARATEAFRWVNTVMSTHDGAWSTYHRCDIAECARRYLSEAEYRVNRASRCASSSRASCTPARAPIPARKKASGMQRCGLVEPRRQSHCRCGCNEYRRPRVAVVLSTCLVKKAPGIAILPSCGRSAKTEPLFGNLRSTAMPGPLRPLKYSGNNPVPHKK